MAERANKGILITTGYFTMSAIKFANDKNLELIDGEKIIELLSDYGLAKMDSVKTKKHFTQYECFDTDKYNYYKQLINQNICTKEMGNDFLFKFMFEYFKSQGKLPQNELNQMLHSGFTEEYIHLFNWFIGKFYKKDKVKIATYERDYKEIALLFHFDIFEYVKNRYEYLAKEDDAIELNYRTDDSYSIYNTLMYKHMFSFDWNKKEYQHIKRYIIDNQMNPNRVQLVKKDIFYEMINLLSLFCYLKIDKGIEYISKKILGRYPEIKELIEKQDEYQESFKRLKIYSIKKWIWKGR